MNNKNNYLEFIRAAAALLVLITHVFMHHPSLSNLNLNVISNWGTEAVMVFFILSGLVINLSQSKNPKTTQFFIFNRLVRLYPQFLVGLALGLIALYVLKFPMPNFKTIIGNIFMVSSLQGYIVETIKTSSPIWSLTFEMFFYILFAICIGKRQKIFLYCWLILSLVLLPFYYIDTQNYLLQHLIMMFSFSPIWIVGYLIYEYKNLFYVDIYTAIISVSLLPLIARLNFSDFIYDPFKFLIFALISIPFFRYALQGKNDGKKVSIYFMVFIYLAMISLLWYNSEARKMSKILYTLLPIVCTFFYIFLNKLNTIIYFKKMVNNFGKIFGKYSYAIYIIHFPIMIILANVCTNVFLFFILVFISLFLVAIFLENILQKNIVKFYKRIF